ncbi:FHF complex subunit HOOK-interacting protein 1B-like isoform X2 [Clavelina lepadiformis]|uniref:FHF complex subunit HOOK-interacting protein 1B-like isoform X2 n=1 Tax=Clavelina lepadiformis TaxID=159417 RepID=UPI004042A88D
MSWIKKLTKREETPKQVQNISLDNTSTICRDAFKSHWLQICEVISATCPRPAYIPTKETRVAKVEKITADDVDTIRNLLEQMIFLLAEEQGSGDSFGPIFEYALTQNIFEKLYEWWHTTSMYKEEMMLNLLKVYEVLISQAQHSLLHHKQLVGPMLKLLSSTFEPRTDELEGHIVLLLNLLCVWMNRDPTLLDVFFGTSTSHGPANFLVFSLLIEYIHREGTVGQQARDALLLCMALSAENVKVADYIVQNSNFCPVLAVGLSGIYSTLPRHMEVRTDDWHCLHRSDWVHVPELTNFMNSFEFCNSVIEVAHESVSNQLLDFFYNGFLVSVFGPSLHKKRGTVESESETSANEVVVTTAYLNLFLRSVTAPALMRCFLKFLLTHCHENNVIINTLIQRIASGNRLALVSLSLIRTLVDINCEDLMLQLIFRYIIPCQHILASQRRAICDVDIHNASASRFLALTPQSCRIETTSKNEDEIFVPVECPEPEQDKTADISHHSLPGISEAVASEPFDGNGAFHTLSPPSPLHDDPPVMPSFCSKSNMHDSSFSSSTNQALSEYTINEDLSVTINMHSGNEHLEMAPNQRTRTITSPSTMAEFGPDLKSQLELNTSYMDYLEDAKTTIDQCRQACQGWSAPYDGIDPSPEGTENKISKLRDTNADLVFESTPVLPRKEESPEITDTSRTAQASAGLQQTSTFTPSGLDASSSGFGHVSRTSSFADTFLQPIEQKSSSESLPSADLNPRLENNATETVIADGQTDTVSDEKNRSDDQLDFDLQNGSSELSEQNLDVVGIFDENLNETVQEIMKLPSEEDSEKLSIPRSNTASSVDEFFRSLMEIVPKTTRDKVENGKAGTSKVAEEDIESGIEVSSDGEIPSTSPECAVAEGEELETLSQQNADSMSQLSLNTDEMEDAFEKVDKEITKLCEDELAATERLGTKANNYSFADDSEDEFDDTASINSSSFYEAADEYSPTEISVSPAAPLKLQGIPYTGPLIGNLFAKLDQMITNSLYENLLLTGIVTRLAAYPQPLLRSFLLNTHMVFHPSVRSLYQVLNSARNKIDAYAARVTDFNVLVRRAQKYLLARGAFPFSGDARKRSIVDEKPMPVPKVQSRTLGGMFRRRKPKDRTNKKSLLPTLETLLERRGRSSSRNSESSEIHPSDGAGDSASMFYVQQKAQQKNRDERKLKELRTKNAVYASIVLAEFLKELAAVAQEHAVTHI